MAAEHKDDTPGSWKDAIDWSKSFNPTDEVSLTGGVFKSSVTAVNTSITGASVSFTGLFVSDSLISQVGTGVQLWTGALGKIGCIASVHAKVTNTENGVIDNRIRALVKQDALLALL